MSQAEADVALAAFNAMAGASARELMLAARIARLEAVVARISECGGRQFPAPDCRVCGEFLGHIHICAEPELGGPPSRGEESGK